MDDKIKKILQLQDLGKSRSEIANMVYNGKPKNNLKSLNRLMKNRGYTLKNNKYIEQDDSSHTSVISTSLSTPTDKDDDCMTDKNKKIAAATGALTVTTEHDNDMTLVINDGMRTNFIDFMNKYEKFEKMLDWFENKDIKDDNRMTQVIEVVEKGIKVDLPEAEEKRTTIRVNSKIWEEFNLLCKRKDNNHLNKRDLISMALKEYTEKYK